MYNQKCFKANWSVKETDDFFKRKMWSLTKLDKAYHQQPHRVVLQVKKY